MMYNTFNIQFMHSLGIEPMPLLYGLQNKPDLAYIINCNAHSWFLILKKSFLVHKYFFKKFFF